MNQQAFEQIFSELPPRRKQVLLQVLSGATDEQIAAVLDIQASTVRKHIERICQAFQLEEKVPGERRAKRSDIVALMAKYKPELLKAPESTVLPDVVDGEIVQHDNLPVLRAASSSELSIWPDQSESGFSSIIMRLWLVTQEMENVLGDLLKLYTDTPEAKKVAKSLNQLGYRCFMEGDFQRATFYLE